MRYLAAASSALRPVLAGPARPASWLGVARGAMYLSTPGPPGVLAVLCHDAVRLPCGLLLPDTAAELPLSSLAPTARPAPAEVLVGAGAVSWTGPAGPVVIHAVREWAPARPVRGTVAAVALAAVRAALADGGADAGIDSELTAGLTSAAHDGDGSDAVARLLGRGPGLTPSGDDVLTGYLTGAAAFGLDAATARQAVALLAPVRTTALSAALLWHAARGECIDELAAAAAVLTSHRPPEHAGPAVSRLLAVGHSSGAALALGLVAAAASALDRQEGRAA